jgi:hypothetical protein
LLIIGCRQLAGVLRVYVEHYNQHRPHRSLGHLAPVPSVPGDPRSGPILGRLRRRDVLGGLIHEYGTQHDTATSGTPREPDATIGRRPGAVRVLAHRGLRRLARRVKAAGLAWNVTR